MCILFLATSSENLQQPDDKYKLILAANRDEYFHRPAQPAEFWGNSNIVGGRDMEPGREGGTWLAMNKAGKIAVLLNILTQAPDPTRLGRGFLVNDFLGSPDLDGLTYAERLNKEAKLYNDFNLVTINVKEPQPDVTYFSNASTNNHIRCFKHSGKMVSAFGNSVFETPFKKVADGKKRVEELIKKFPSKAHKEDLINGLLDILKDKESFYPDPQMSKQVDDILLRKGMSSRFVEIPSLNYGSRTHTVILVDFENQVEFHEWTMTEPINQDSVEWGHQKFVFELD